MKVPRFMLDTNICIYIAKQKPVTVLERFEQLSLGEVAMSTITYGELLFGANKSHYADQSHAILNKLSELIPSLEMPTHTAENYAKIRFDLEKQGKPIGNNDLWIAAHALSMDLTLVSNNLREFERVSYLQLENWVS